MQLHLSLDPDPLLVCVRDRLRVALGPIMAFRRRDPISQLVHAVLGSRTYDAVSEAVFAALRARFSPWGRLADARMDEVATIVAPVTYAETKAGWLIAALRRIRGEAGGLRLDFLEHWPLDDAMAWLQALPGVGQKVAASVLNFSTLGRRVLVVDGYVLRVLGRLGVGDGRDAGACREAAMELTPEGWTSQDLLELHVHLKGIGQSVCHASAPQCPDCPLNDLCPHPARDWLTRAEAVSVAANENKSETTTQAALDAYVRRRLARLERAGVAPATLLAQGVSLGRPELDEVFVGGRLPPGAHQSAGAAMEDGATALVPALAVVAMQGHDARTIPAPAPAPGGRRVLVVQEADSRREHGELHGPGIEALGLDSRRLAFVRARDGPQALQAADEALRRHAAAAVVVELRRGAHLLDLSVTRRFNLQARRAGLFLFLITPDLGGASAAATRWRSASAASQAPRRRVGPPTFHLELVRNRSGRTGSWIVEWSAHEHRFLSARPVVPPSESGCAREPAARAAVLAPVGAFAGHRPGAA